ncbi:hypothetical protein, partial [Citrobacter freundii]
LHGDVLMWLMKTLLTSGCTNQRGAGQVLELILTLLILVPLINRMKLMKGGVEFLVQWVIFWIMQL